ncbi:MAG: peptide-methionine (S)-S-oxide reductase MsrA [Planctomycetota bacterium]
MNANLKKPHTALAALSVVSFTAIFLSQALPLQAQSDTQKQSPASTAETHLERATFGGGCFWCTEAVFESVDGVRSVASGFMGGRKKNPTYEQVKTGRTGHAEVVHIEFDSSKVAFSKLLEIFWKTHDPTTKNRQGPDIGPMYRSVVFAHSVEQAKVAREYKKKLNRQKVFGKPVLTKIEMAETFYPADDAHQNYFAQNRDAPYCVNVIGPKLRKLQAVFADQLKSDPTEPSSSD